MSAARESHRTRRRVLVLTIALASASCVQQGLSQRPRTGPYREVAAAPPEATSVTEVERGQLSLPESQPVRRTGERPKTRSTLDTRVLVPPDPAPPVEVEEQSVHVELPADPPAEPVRKSLASPLTALPPEEPPPAETPEPALAPPPRVDLRGEIRSQATGMPVESSSPLLVLAFPETGVGAPGPEGIVPCDLSIAPPVARRDPDGFSPDFVVTSPGCGVRFENHDQICHSFFSSSEPNAFDLGLLNPGESRTVDLQHPGPVQVYCSLHAGKQLSLLVVPTPHHAVVDPDGGFVIENLVPGDYHLETWCDDVRLRRLRVHVTATGMQPVLFHIDPAAAKGVE